MRRIGGLTVLVGAAALVAACGGGGQTATPTPRDEAAEAGVTHAVEADAPDSEEPDARDAGEPNVAEPTTTVAQSAPAPVDYAPHRGTRREGVPAVGRTLGHPSAPILIAEWSDFQ